MPSNDGQGVASELTVIAETSPGQSASSQIATSPTRSVANKTAPVASTSTAVNTSRRAPQRTYGKKVAVSAEAPAPTTTASRPLQAADSFVHPETDFGQPSEPELPRRTELPSGSSSPSRQTQHSTDPTSEEDHVPNKGDKPDRALPSVLDGGLSADDSDSPDEDDQDEDEDDVFKFYKAGRSLKDQLEQMDKDEVPAGLAPKPDDRPTREDTPKSDKGESSGLPALTPSEDQGSESRARGAVDDIEALPRGEPAASSQPTSPIPGPSRTSRPGKTGRKMRIADSEDEDEEDDHEKREASRTLPPQLPTPAPTAAPSRKERIKELAARRQRESEEKEAARRGKSASVAPPAREQEVEGPADDEMDEVDKIVNGTPGGKQKKNGMIHRGKGIKPKRLGKKQEEEMNQTSAKLAREKDVRLEPTRKGTISVFDVLKQHRSELPKPETRPVGQPPRRVPDINLASDSTIENSPPEQALATPARSYSLNAPRQRRPAGTPDHIVNETPLPPRRAREASAACLTEGWHLRRDREPKKAPVEQKAVDAATAAAAANDDDDDEEEEGDLSALDLSAEVRRAAERERQKKDVERLEKKAAQLQERKLKAAAAARTSDKTTVPDSDSDLEIEGLPKLKSASSHSRRQRTPDQYEDTLAAYANDKVSGKNDNPALRLLQEYGRIDPAHPPSEENAPTDSQFEFAGKTFGAHLNPRMSYEPDSTAKRRTARLKGPKPAATTVEEVNARLTSLSRQQAATVRQKKELKARREANERAHAPSELATVDVDALVKEKQSREEEDEKMEEDADGDYVDSEAEPYDSADLGSDDGGSGDEAGSASEAAAESDTPAPVPKRREPSEAGDDALDSEGEMILPRSSQNEDRLGKAHETADVEEGDEDDSSMPPLQTARTGRKLRIVDDDDEETVEPAAAPLPAVAKTPAPARVALGGLVADLAGEDGGFSQFFDSQFSQGGDEADIMDGFQRGAQDAFPAPAATMFALQPLIGTAERDADADRLETRGGFNDFELTTPREIAAPRQYINDKGLLTQTRPAAQFESPSETPSRSYRQSLSDRDSQSQAYDETQLATAQTPTQAFRHPNALRRTSALVHFDSIPELAPTEQAATRSSETQLEETQVDDASGDASLPAIDEETQQEAQVITSTDEASEETQDVRPSAAQPSAAASRNAFDVLRAGAAPTPPRPVKRRGPNEFIAAEADLSDEEQAGFGLGGVSGDENEDDDDRELDELVDNTKEDADVEAEQDEKARELRAEQEAKREAEEFARAQRIAAGKERKRGRNELDDDDFDDDYVRGGRGEKRERVEQETVADLLKNEETQRFGETLDKACVPESVDSQWLYEKAPLAGDDDGDDEDMADGVDVFGPREPRPAVNSHEVRKRAAEIQRARGPAERDPSDSNLDEDVLSLPGSPSSSPRTKVEIRKRVAKFAVASAPKTASNSFTSLESASLMFSNKSAIVYGGAGGEDSQTASFAGNSRGAITGFKRSAAGATKVGGTASTKAKSNALGPRPSKFSGLRRQDFG